LVFTPTQLRAELATVKNTPHETRYALYTQLTNSELRQLESPLVPRAVVVSLKEHASGLRLAMLTIQSAGTQHRFVVPLVSSLETGWLAESAALGSACIAVDVDEVGQLALVSMPFALPTDWSVERLETSACQLTSDQVFNAMNDLLPELRSPATVPDLLSSFGPTHVELFIAVQSAVERAVLEQAPLLNS
jgi:hypothetical protein